MNITLSQSAGFCPGVKRADQKVRELISMGNIRIFTLGSLIHNRLYNDELRGLGVEAIDISNLDEILSCDIETTLIIRTHGITKEENDILLNAERTNEHFHLVDMTCPYVKKIHKIAEDNTGENTAFILFCDKNHPEAKGILSYAKGYKFPISSLEEAQNLNLGKKVPILCSQTTQNLLEFKEIINFFKKLYTNLIFFDTICNVTENRQIEAITLAKNSDAMIIIGGHESSNTAKLYKLSCENCKNSYWIESANDVKNIALPAETKCLGITAGASTPENIILEVLHQCKMN